MTYNLTSCENNADCRLIQDVSRNSDKLDVCQNNITYVALGDSIAYGHGIENHTFNGYPGVLADKIKEHLGLEVNYKNLARSGMDTQGMIDYLDSVDAELKGADLVTVCIGANNLLQPFIETLTNAIKKYCTVDITGKINNIDLNRFVEFTASFGNVLTSPEMLCAMQIGLENFENDYSLIISQIKEKAPKARIVVMTVYSPYAGINFRVPYLGQEVNLGANSDKWVSKLNEVLIEIAENGGCKVVETYQQFRGKSGLIKACASIIPLKFSVDPHPTIEGHKLLAELHFQRVKEMFQ